VHSRGTCATSPFTVRTDLDLIEMGLSAVDLYGFRRGGGAKTQSGRFPCKSGLLSKKVCYKVSLCENSQRQTCKVFTDLFNCAQIVGGEYLLPVILGQTDPPLKNADFESIFSHSVAVITKKVQLSLIRSPL